MVLYHSFKINVKTKNQASKPYYRIKTNTLHTIINNKLLFIRIKV